VLLTARRDLGAARRFFSRALRLATVPAEVTTDRAPSYPRVLNELIPSALHTVERYANNPVENDHGRLKARLRPMRTQAPPVRADLRRRAGARAEHPPRTLRLATDAPAATGSAQRSISSP
jgi:transposase-like protein